MAPGLSVAQGFDAAPSGSFSFETFGDVQAGVLPLEMADESRPAPVAPPLRVVDLGTTPVLTEAETASAPVRQIQNTWSIGVFR
ncbi:hypothetical protein [Yoonia sp. SS1-5]|uniref:Uncharacterized protein n=1 Tax=Yoonia rhodophyticola TaxID=3137370 RepID=A0AAN0MB09_9RHOB